MIITFGKYRGSTISEIALIDIGYVIWLYEKNISKELTKESKRQLAIFTKEIILILRINKVMDFNRFDGNTRALIKKMYTEKFEFYGKEMFRITTRTYFNIFKNFLPKEIKLFFLENPDSHNVLSLSPIIYSRYILVEKYKEDTIANFLPF